MPKQVELTEQEMNLIISLLQEAMDARVVSQFLVKVGTNIIKKFQEE